MTPDVIGAVLAGGRGRRLRAEKASQKIGDRTLVRRAFDALRSAGLEVTLVLRARQRVPLTKSDVDIVRDTVEDAGPLGGLHALLRGLPVEWALVVPCDQPLLSPELLRELLAQTRSDTDVVIGEPAELLEPLPGLYRRTCLPAIEAALARGERSLHHLLASLRVRAVPAKTLRRRDPRLLSYVNVNTPEDLARARDLIAAVEAENQ